MIKIKKDNLTKENLMKIKNLDSLFYKEDILTDEWYLERYNSNHSGIFLYDDEICIGYLVSIPITKELYKAIINGVIINDLYINPKMILNKSKYNYIVSSLIKEEYRNIGYGKLMMEELFKVKGKYCALTITKEGYSLANKYMKHKLKINNQVNVFIKTI